MSASKESAHAVRASGSEIMRVALLDLAARVEAATGPDRELDALIRAAVFAPADAFVEQSSINGAWCIYVGRDRAGRPRSWEAHGLAQLQRLGECTASLDAAMTLKPEGWRLSSIAEYGDGRAGACWTLPGKWDCGTIAATPALALCAAALRAHAQITPSLSSQVADDARNGSSAKGIET